MKDWLTKRRIIKGKKGVALAYAILVLMFIAVFSVSILALFSGNLRQAEYQKHYTQAYYLAYSGVEMAFSALIAEDSAGNPNDLFNQFKDGSLSSLSQDDIAFGDGLIDIDVSIVTDLASPYVGWIKISSTGTLNIPNISVSRNFYIDPLDQQNVVWRSN